PGEGTADQNVCSISLATTPSSLGDDSGDLSVHCACTIPQTLNTPHETISGTATDIVNPNTKSAGPTKPAGAPRTGNARDVNKEVKGTGGKVDAQQSQRGEAIEDEKGGRASGSVTPSSNDGGGDEDIHHVYVVPKTTQPVPYHISPCPEQHDNDNATKAYTTAAQGRADIVHDPGGSTDSPGSHP
ncbi:hypothetical protein PAXRUDRAFT_167412, partial [Paxillus rubicundulus Ve08.2h10]